MSKKFKLIINDWKNGELKKEEFCFDKLEDAKFKIKYLKMSSDENIKVKIYDQDLKLIHSEFIQRTMMPINPKRGKGHKGEHDEGYNCDETYA